MAHDQLREDGDSGQGGGRRGHDLRGGPARFDQQHQGDGHRRQGRGRRPVPRRPRRGQHPDRLTPLPASDAGYTYRREMLVATIAGLLCPSTSTVTVIAICTPPSKGVAESSVALARTRDPTGTGAGKRTFSVP